MGLKFNDGFAAKLRGISDRSRARLQQAVRRNGELLRTTVIRVIRNQEIKFVPHSPAYLRSKRKKNQLFLVNEGDYSASFESTDVGPFETHVGSNAPQARSMEFGFEPQGIPARAHLGPSLEMTKPEMKENYRAAVRETFGK